MRLADDFKFEGKSFVTGHVRGCLSARSCLVFGRPCCCIPLTDICEGSLERGCSLAGNDRNDLQSFCGNIAWPAIVWAKS